MMKVDFFVAGIQKGGTTALDAFLRRHPLIQMARVKEPHMFDDEAIDWSAPNFEKLHALYDWSDTRVIRGEATPIYTYWPPALLRLKSYNPDAKLIVGLRHPAFRAFSHWRMESSRDAESLSFSEAVREGRKRVADTPDGVHRVYSYVERGLYRAQLERLGAFERTRVHYFRTDALWARPQDTLREIQHFLGVEPTDLGGQEYTVPVEPKDLGAPTLDDLEYLQSLFRNDICAVSAATGLDLSDWEDPRYREPMPSPGALP